MIDPERRDPLDDAPPLGTWPRIHALIVGALVLQIALYTWLTRAFS